MAWTRKNDAKATSSPAASVTAPRTSALAASTARRRGAAVNVVRISPVLYSALKASTPMTLTAITAYSRLRTSGSSGSGGGPAEAGWLAKAKATRALAPIGVTTATSSDQKDDRTERNLVHSEATRSSARMASEGAGVLADRAAGVLAASTGVSWLILVPSLHRGSRRSPR